VMAEGSRGLLLVEGGRRGDEAHVREGLREIPHGLAASRADLLGEEADLVRETAEALEKRLRLLVVARVREVFRRPEVARRERVLGPGDAVVARVVGVTHDEAVAIERLRDVAVGSCHARMAGLAIAVAREEEEARVRVLAAIVAHVAPELVVVAALLDLGADRLALPREPLAVHRHG